MPKNPPVEAKVKASTTATFVVSLLIAVLSTANENRTLLDPLPTWLQFVVISLIPTGITFLAGWQARHTPRGPISDV